MNKFGIKLEMYVHPYRTNVHNLVSFRAYHRHDDTSVTAVCPMDHYRAQDLPECKTRTAAPDWLMLIGCCYLAVVADWLRQS